MSIEIRDSEPCVLVYAGCFVPDYFPIELFLRTHKIPFKVLSDQDMANFTFQTSHRLFIFPSGQYFGDTPEDAIGGRTGRENLKRAIANGMSYLGICAGAFAATQRSYYPIDISLGLTKMRHRWPNEMGAGAQFLTVRLNEELIQAAQLDQDTLRLWYHNGPILSVNASSGFTVLAVFQPSKAERNVAKNGFLKGKHLLHAPAIVALKHGNGRVILCSPHLEFGDMGVRDYQSLLRQWLTEHNCTDVQDDPLKPGMPAQCDFMKSLGGQLMEPVRRSKNWKCLLAIVVDLLESRKSGGSI
ncbi:MAG: BPL-N domain-containing protein [Armatimonadetes bacterium]|nr:BPL-N domain-containing protein [Armatimonadota bacterium]